MTAINVLGLKETSNPALKQLDENVDISDQVQAVIDESTALLSQALTQTYTNMLSQKAEQTEVTAINMSIDNIHINKADKTTVDSLNSAMSALQSLVASDDISLDDLQEIVDFIKINKSTLDALSIASIAGLQTALDVQSTVNTDVQTQIGDVEAVLIAINGIVV